MKQRFLIGSVAVVVLYYFMRQPLPTPWSIDELEACFVVIDSAGQKLAYVYFEEEPSRRSAAKLLTKDETQQIAANIAKLTELLRKD